MNPLFASFSLGCLLILAQVSACGGSDPDCTGDDAGHPDCEELLAAEGTALWISDIHLDIFDVGTATLERLIDPSDSTWRDGSEWATILDPSQGSVSRRGVDANYQLFQTVLDRAKTTVPNADFVLVTGDLLGHEFGLNYASTAPSGAVRGTIPMQTSTHYVDFVAQTIRYIASSLRADVPDSVPIFVTLGNNDAYCGDYDVRSDTPVSGQPNPSAPDFLDDTVETLFTYLLPGLSDAEKTAIRASFDEGGNYAAKLPGTAGNRILMVNTIPYMRKYQPAFPDSTVYPPYAGIASTCTSLQKINPATTAAWTRANVPDSGRAWIAMHVPPGSDCYGNDSDWDSSRPFQADFVSLFTDPTTGPRMAGSFAAHSHMASFKVVEDPAGPVGFVLQAPSIGSNHGNNAAFSVLTYDPDDLSIENLEVHYLGLVDSRPSARAGTWGAYDFAGLSGPITADTLGALYDSFTSGDTSRWTPFARSYAVQSNPDSTLTSHPVRFNDLRLDSPGCLAL